MAKYRKKPVVIDAIRFDGENITKCELFGGGVKGRVFYDGARLRIRTPEGTMTVSPGDWLIRGVAGEFYPCKPEIFEETYQPVEDD